MSNAECVSGCHNLVKLRVRARGSVWALKYPGRGEQRTGSW